MSSPIISGTIQACVLSATSNIIAQFLTAYRNDKSFVTDFKPIFQFVLYTILSTPPNMMWQYFLESSFPSTYASPSKSAIDAASKSNEAELDREEKTHEITEERLSIRNLIIKVILDQTISASANTLMFSLAFAGFNRMGYADAWAEARSQYWGLMLAGWKLWPLVSLVGFSVVKSVEGRNLLGSLAGLGWGVYLSLTMGGQTEVKEL
ncbi:uncharacterized protein K444DRAFT_634224 [Hyaloscypha bicolor E]|uniref:Integral membrane protein-like protein n=1 Tax=Hyaloscypha bicolor E TaxID=1095630 RepID=A0A2J6SUZ8_9HELO|nr:uncharacterized protein K444DRAFT_634224 [Hyaloscypha bicolor E]PMD54493.1 hypothetical protein K444DRAFT_634224 [Hyaloscypha bicolor E]